MLVYEYFGDPFKVHWVTDELYRERGRMYIRKFIPKGIDKVPKLLARGLLKKVIISKWPRITDYENVCIRNNYKYDGLYLITVQYKDNKEKVRSVLNTNNILGRKSDDVITDIRQYRPTPKCYDDGD